MKNATASGKPPVGYLRMKSRRPLTEEERNTRNLKSQSSWYDHGYEVFEVVGPMDTSRILSALHKRFYAPSYGKFGGGLSIGTVTEFDPTHVLVEFIYHIGD